MWWNLTNLDCPFLQPVLDFPNHEMRNFKSDSIPSDGQLVNFLLQYLTILSFLALRVPMLHVLPR